MSTTRMIEFETYGPDRTLRIVPGRRSMKVRPMTLSTEAIAEFEFSRDRLRTLAFRILGTEANAEDVVQDAWLRYSQANLAQIRHVQAWLTRVVVRLCLDALRRHRPVELESSETVSDTDGRDSDPEGMALRANDLTDAFVMILDSLTPPQRVAFVLHEAFGMPFEEIADALGTTPGSAKKLASRARGKLRARPPISNPDVEEAERIVAIFLDAAQHGDTERLLSVLAPDAIRTADAQVLPAGRPRFLRGAETIAAEASLFRSAAARARIVTIGDLPGLMVANHGRIRLAIAFTFREGRIASYDVIADPNRLDRLPIR